MTGELVGCCAVLESSSAATAACAAPVSCVVATTTSAAASAAAAAAGTVFDEVDAARPCSAAAGATVASPDDAESAAALGCPASSPDDDEDDGIAAVCAPAATYPYGFSSDGSCRSCIGSTGIGGGAPIAARSSSGCHAGRSGWRPAACACPSRGSSCHGGNCGWTSSGSGGGGASGGVFASGVCGTSQVVGSQTCGKASSRPPAGQGRAHDWCHAGVYLSEHGQRRGGRRVGQRWRGDRVEKATRTTPTLRVSNNTWTRAPSDVV